MCIYAASRRSLHFHGPSLCTLAELCCCRAVFKELYSIQGGGRGFVLTQCWIFHAVCFVLAPQGVSDDEYGLAAAIVESSYNMTEPATRYQPWVATVLQQYSAFGNFATSSGLPANVQQKVCFERRCRFSTASGQVHGLCSGRGHCKHSLLRLSIAPSLF